MALHCKRDCRCPARTDGSRYATDSRRGVNDYDVLAHLWVTWHNKHRQTTLGFGAVFRANCRYICCRIAWRLKHKISEVMGQRGADRQPEGTVVLDEA